MPTDPKDEKEFESVPVIDQTETPPEKTAAAELETTAQPEKEESPWAKIESSLNAIREAQTAEIQRGTNLSDRLIALESKLSALTTQPEPEPEELEVELPPEPETVEKPLSRKEQARSKRRRALQSRRKESG